MATPTLPTSPPSETTLLTGGCTGGAEHNLDQKPDAHHSLIETVFSHVPHFDRDDPSQERVCQYETSKLGTWRTFLYTAGTVWRTQQLWGVAFNLVMVSCFVAFCTFFVTVSPEGLKPEAFSKVANCLKVILAFLLGYYLTSSVNRWAATVEGFLMLFNSARNLINQLHALGVSPHWIRKCTRYGILSAKFLSLELRAQVQQASGQNQTSLDEETGCIVHESVEALMLEGLLEASEAATLHKVADHPSLVWVWVAMTIGKMAQEGEVPPMSSPTYGRLMQLTQSAQDGIRKVYVSTMVQMPFVYVHLLAMLVHINNILCAFSFGCTLGQSLSAILGRMGFFLYIKTPRHHDTDIAIGSIQGDLQIILMSFVSCFFAPLLYQAALQIGLSLAQPFNTKVGNIPTARLIHELKRDLAHAQIMADSPPGFEKPHFRQKA